MKFGLCLALVVLLASANVFAEENIEMNLSTSENLDISSMSNIEQESTTPLSMVENETTPETSTETEMNTNKHEERSDLPDEKPRLRSFLPDEKPRLGLSLRTRPGSLNKEPTPVEDESPSEVSSELPTGSTKKLSKLEQNERLGSNARRTGRKKVSAVVKEATSAEASVKSEERLRTKNSKSKVEKHEQSVETGNDADLLKQNQKVKASASIVNEEAHEEEQSHVKEASHKASSSSSAVHEHVDETAVDEDKEDGRIETANTGSKKTSWSAVNQEAHEAEQSHVKESSHKASSSSSAVHEHVDETAVDENIEDEHLETANTGSKKTSSSMVSEEAHEEEHSHVKESSHKASSSSSSAVHEHVDETAVNENIEDEHIETADTGSKKTSSSVVSEEAHEEEHSHVEESSHKASSSSSSVTEHVEENEVVPGKRPSKVVQLRPSATTDFPIVLKNLVRVTGSISIAPSRESLVGSVQYDIKGGRWNKKNLSQNKLRLPNELNFIAPNSEVMIYVSTVNTFDRRQAFVNFSIPLASDRFPLEFNIDITLPNAQRRLLQSADIVLYFYAYAWDPETRLETFVPEGVSQVLLQGTNQVVQRVDVFVKPNGLELKGLFNGLYGEKFIRPGTTYQILIIAEESISRLTSGKVDYVAQILINNVPAIYPFPFIGTVPYQKLKEGTRYFAAIYIFEHGVERLLTSVPILVINEKRVVVTTELIVNVFPFPLILHGTITRSMPGSFHFEPNSSVILSIYEIESESPPSTFRLNSIDRLPQDFEVNISRWANFDVMKRYEVQATVVDGKNQIYMANRQKVALQTTSARITIPVDDLFYHVHVTFHSSLNQPLSYISGSEAVLIITDNPETTSTPLFDARFDPDEFKSTGYMMKISMDTIQRVGNAYLILLVNSSGTITHVSKILLISNGQQPALRVELPVIALSLIRGQIVDSENLPAQWSPLSYATLQLIDDNVEDLTKAVVQVWKIYLERDFPINFNVHLDFSLLLSGHSYSLQAYIETSPKVLWYKPVEAVRVIEPEQRIQDNIRLTVESVMTHQLIQGVVYLDEVADILNADSEVVIQLSSTSSLERPDVLYETHVIPKKGELKTNFVFNVSLERIDINSIYYFTIKYVSGSKLIIAPKQAYAFSPRNQISVILRLSKNEQIRITGQALSTGGPLVLPEGSILSLQITDHAYSENATVYADVDLEASPRNQYKFTMYLNSVWLRRNVTLYLRAAILHNDEVILSIPRPAPIQIVTGTEWNINLRIDLPTLVIGYISLLGEEVPLNGDFDAYVQILASGTENVLSTTRLRMGDTWPQPIRVEVDNVLFAQYSKLEARALIKNCKEELLFRSAGNVAISSRLNIDINLPIVVHDPQLLKNLSEDISSEAPLSAGAWSVSITGTSASGSGEPVAEIDEEEGEERK